jgi:hypothetical protein
MLGRTVDAVGAQPIRVRQWRGGAVVRPPRGETRMPEDTPRPWHRLFGVTLTDLFAGTPWRVELEKELALRSQLLDVVIIEQGAGGERTDAVAGLELPDGLEGLRAHNLLTYKSQHEALDGWAVEELIGHYVNYRKLLMSASKQQALPAAASFQLYAVATRHPAKLAAGVQLAATPWPGVFDLHWGTRRIRLIVLGAIAKHPRNAPWELFSAEMDRIRHGVAHYRARTPQTAALLHELYFRYRLELPTMAYTLDDYARDSHRFILDHLTPEQRRAFLREVPPAERLRDLSPEERRAFLREVPPEERLSGLPPEERLRGLSPEDIRKLKAHLDQLGVTSDAEDVPGS